MNSRHLLAIGTLMTLLLVPLLAAADDGPSDEKLWKKATVFFKPLPPKASNPENPVTAAKVELGKKLYMDKRLSKDGNISCDSCHSLAAFGVDRLPTSPGDTGEFGDRNSPTVLNAALHKAQFWDGRAEDVEEQAGMPILNPVEMAIPSEEFLVNRLVEIPEYRESFAEAFPGEEPQLTYANISRALAAFERTLLTPSRFDRYLEGDRQALTEMELSGLETFIATGCVSCHNGVNLGAHIFRKFGLSEDYWHHTKSKKIDEGRFRETKDKEDMYVFKVASLRNVAMTYPYFHDGSVATLEEAIRVMAKLQASTELADKAEDVAAFLQTLTGEVPDEAMSASGTR